MCWLKEKLVLICAVLLLVTFAGSCSIPALESADCFEARDAVKSFYSFHLGNDIKFTAENLALREKYLSPKLIADLRKFLTESDPFTLNDKPPRAFRSAACKVIEPGSKTSFQIQLLWRDDTASKQEEITVDAVKTDGKWLIDNIYNDKIDLRRSLEP